MGQYKPLLITKDNIVIGGNMRLKAYQKLGIDQVWVSVVEPKNEAEMVKYALSDNDRAGYYVEQDLAELITQYGAEIVLEDYKVDLGEPINLVELLNRYGPDDVIEDEAPELPAEAISKLGEVYQLGRHRLMCGDATKIEDVEKLMDGKKADCIYTDPPYGMNLDTNYDKLYQSGKNKYNSHINKGDRFEKVIADDTYFDPTFLLDKAKEIFLWGADYFYDSLPRGGSLSAWDKRSETLDKLPGNSTEFLWSKIPHKRLTARILWSGHHGMGKDDDKIRVHPTQKPIKLHKWFFDNYGNGLNIILDLFGGSGSTLIACEQLERECYMMELDPKYCDVIRTRYDNFINNRQINGKD